MLSGKNLQDFGSVVRLFLIVADNVVASNSAN